MQVEKIKLGLYSTNCYLIIFEEDKECILIDPADNADYLINMIEDRNLTPKAILLTHGHYDHLLAVPGLQKKWPDLKVYCHYLDIPEEEFEYDMGYKFPTVKSFNNLVKLKNKDILTFSNTEFTVLHTPGHTPGSVIYISKYGIFTGDTIFRASIGRTDFPGGNDTDMYNSLKLIRDLDIYDTKLYPGHEDVTTLKWERENNIYLQNLK